MITRHAHQMEALTDHERFSSKRAYSVSAMVGESWKLAPLEYDPPGQQDFRRIVNPFFTPKSVRLMEEVVAVACDRLLDVVAARGRCDFVADFAVPFPTYIFLSIMGMPQEQAPQFLRWEEQLMRGKTMQLRAAAAQGVTDYLRSFIAQQKAAPSTDFMSAIVSGQVEGRAIADDEILGLVFTFYVGGLDTVYSTLGWIMRHLAMNPELQAKLRAEPELIEKSMEEFARAYSVVSCLRTATQDFEFHGVTMKKGDQVLMPLFLSGRDPDAWDNPHAIDLTRRPAALTFGSGAHMCAGRQLALRELRVAMRAWLTRFDNIRLAPDSAYAFHTSPVYGVDRLELEFDI